MNEEIVLQKMAARLGVSVTALRMQLATQDTNGRDIMQDIVADNRHPPHVPSSAIPQDRGSMKAEVPVEATGSGWSATYIRNKGL